MKFKYKENLSCSFILRVETIFFKKIIELKLNSEVYLFRQIYGYKNQICHKKYIVIDGPLADLELNGLLLGLPGLLDFKKQNRLPPGRLPDFSARE